MWGKHVVGLTIIMFVLVCCGGLFISCVAIGVMGSNVYSSVDLKPPSIELRYITYDNATRMLNFAYIVSDEGHGGSSIIKTRVYLYRTPKSGDTDIDPKITVNSHDNISDLDYEIRISLSNIDCVWGTADDNGLVDVKDVEASLDLDLDKSNKVSWFINGTFTFDEIYTECKYYMIVVAVDYYGNAYWVIYNVTSEVHNLTDTSTSTSSSKGRVAPQIAPINMQGSLEPTGLISHYYTIDSTPYIPWIRLRARYQRCFTLAVTTGGRRVEIDALGVKTDDNTHGFGIFILKPYGLWGLGQMKILVDGVERWRIRFMCGVGRYMIAIAMIYVGVACMVAMLILPRRYRRRGGGGG